ncbi:FtsX-like permease family protein, partial [bacterium]|nr:FtsX-like permease family protein [bacterium]
LFVLKTVFHSIKHRKFSVLVSICAISAAFAALSAAGCISFGLAATAVNSSLAFPLVIGPAGAGDTGLVMSAIFNIDKPNGTLDYEISEKLSHDPRVTAIFPLARSDSYMGIPITGVESAYINEIARGFSGISNDIEAYDIFGENGRKCAVLGAKIAARYEMEVGDTFFGSHGNVGDEEAHMHDFEYKVCAVMKAVNGPEDFAIFTNLKSVWDIHKYSHHHGENEEHEHHHETAEMHCVHDMCVEVGNKHHAERKITAILVKTANPVATASLEREFSENGLTSAADTGKTVRKIITYMNKAEKAIGFFVYGTLFLVLTLIFVIISASINGRKKELALMRTLGIGKMPISLTILTESFFISISGILFGICTGHLLLAIFKSKLDFLLEINLEPFVLTDVEFQGTVLAALFVLALSLAATVRFYTMNIVEEIAKE